MMTEAIPKCTHMKPNFTSLNFWWMCYVFCQTLAPSAVAQGLATPTFRGLNFVAPPEPFTADPMKAIKNLGCNWIALIPYAFAEAGKPDVHFSNLSWQWWGETESGIQESIRLAKRSGIQVMLKPQVYMHNAWVGTMSFGHEKDWLAWENAYREYIMFYAGMAAKHQLQLFCISTEFDRAAILRESFFRTLICDIRSIYKGKLVYSANWDQYQNIPFWDQLDYIGISAYFPLRDDKVPEIPDLIQAWEIPIQHLENYSMRLQKPLLFTEFGYLSVEGCAGKTWELEKCLDQIPINQKAQANALEALFCCFWNQSWWAGGFLWKWYPEGKGHEGHPERDYTPQNKRAVNVLKNWYCGP